MKYTLAIFVTFLLLLIAPACSDSEQFRVNGVIEGKPTMNLRAGYYADGAYRSIITAVREGEFEFYGNASTPALLELTDYDHRPIGRLYVVNGETYTMHLDPAVPYSARTDGSDVNSRWSTFLRDNAQAMIADPNATVAAYIASHPGDVVSTLLLLTAYDSSRSPLEADSLMALIAPEARPASLTDSYNALLQRLVTEDATGPVAAVSYLDRRDSLLSFTPADSPASLIVISQSTEGRSDSIVSALRRLTRGTHHPAVLDFFIDTDTISWKRAAAADSASWRQGWLPGGLAAPALQNLGVPATPYFIACDSTGRRYYAGPSLTRAVALADSLIKARKQ